MKSEFLLIEYQRLQQLHFTEKKDSEQRINFFIAITTGAIGGVILLFQRNKSEINYIIFLTEVVLLLLTMIGLNTLGRVAIATIQSLKIMELRKVIKTILANDSRATKKYIDAQNDIINFTHEKSYSSLLQNSTTSSFLVITINTFLIGGLIFIPFVYYGQNLYCNNLLIAILIMLPTLLLIRIMLFKYYKILKRKLQIWKSSF